MEATLPDSKIFIKYGIENRSPDFLLILPTNNTKFSNFHFPASKDAEQRIIKLGENTNNVFCVGCPRIDLVSEIISKNENNEIKYVFAEGVGSKFDLNVPA